MWQYNLRWYDRGMRIQGDGETTHDKDDKDDKDKDDKDGKDKDDTDDKDDDEISVESG